MYCNHTTEEWNALLETIFVTRPSRGGGQQPKGFEAVLKHKSPTGNGRRLRVHRLLGWPGHSKIVKSAQGQLKGG